ncbi:hypothetical protein [Flammeovirga sp. SJP92]|uniref:hypothetical protein n=1 Tax=Flammeovirga sp. SJP92 TaxID=1775430 RepID=UPI0007886DC3|nr:hypothetical protein [Flammeovirga sp. SJP92]KXX69239.1 hypothetical protein AVL50_16385 [Flammeovirga sp. SJP92]
MNLRELSQEIYSNASEKAYFYPVDRNFIQIYLGRIRLCNNFEFIIYNLNNYPETYSVQLLTCIPEIYEEFSLNDWSEILTRSSTFGVFSAIEFLFKYLEINAFKLYFDLPQVSIKDKKTVVDYFVECGMFLFKDEDDYQDFEEGYLAELNTLISIKEKMLINSKLYSAFTQKKDLYTYLDDYKQKA